MGKQRTPVAIIYNRPYPILDFGPGEYNGTETFSSAKIAIAFFGMRAARHDPERAAQIKRDGVDIGRSSSGGLVRNPELVLGAQAVADDLAQTFVAHRKEESEDFRGKYHVTFQVQRTAGGHIPRGLMEISAEDLAKEFTKRIIWIEEHNVHRANEGGGYAGKTFLDVLEEGREKALLWPSVSVESTELFRRSVGDLEILAAETGLDATVTVNYETGVIRRLLKEEIKRLVKAVRRERKNYAEYDLDWLQEAQATARMSLQDRLRDLEQLEKRMLDRLSILDPKDATVD
jgi:hypothetical protein